MEKEKEIVDVEVEKTLEGWAKDAQRMAEGINKIPDYSDRVTAFELVTKTLLAYSDIDILEVDRIADEVKRGILELLLTGKFPAWGQKW